MKKHIPTVTVAVCAYNEEKNIQAFLRSVLMQKEEGFVIEKILVISDGSTDKTVSIIKSFKSTKIVVKHYDKRIGKSSRLNEIYNELTSDILVQSDGDVVFSHPYVVRDIINPLIIDKKVKMCGGNPQPIEAKTFIEKAINCSVSVYSEFRKKVRGGNNVFSADGRLLAYKKEFIQNVTVPSDMIANDMFTYFCCLSRGFEYRYVDSAIVSFRSPQTLEDHIRQNTRFLAAPIRMKKYFNEELVEREIKVPRIIFLESALLQFLRHPILSLSIYIINKYCKLRAKRIEERLTAKWDMANTTKSLS